MSRFAYPVDTDQFQIIRENGMLYVDKTDMMWELADRYSYVFLARPRRFGKSLLCNTFKAYFQGQKELFYGLKVMELEKEWKKYPVLHFTMSGLKNCTVPGAGFLRLYKLVNVINHIIIKNFMRRLLLIYVLLYILSQSVSAKEACALMIHLSSGKQLVCLLDERPVVTFTDEEVVLTTHMHEVRYQSADVQKFTYTNVVVDGIHATLVEKGLVRVDGNNLRLGGFAPDSDVSVYTVDGVLVVVTRTDGHGAASVTLPEQSGKVYVVKTSVANFKIMKP